MTEDKKWCVYCHEKKDDGRKYIGITCRQTKDRWGKDGYGYKTSSYFYNAILSYGWDSFSHTILKEELTEKEAKKLERQYIKEFKTNQKGFGFNLTAGGDGTVGYLFTREMQEKRGTCKEVVQLTKTGKFIKEYYNIHEAARAVDGNFGHISGCCNHIYGRKSTKGYLWMFKDEYENWDGNLERYRPDTGKRDISVLCFDLANNFLKEYKNGETASRDLCIKNDYIRYSCNVNNKEKSLQASIYGYKFLYKKDVDRCVYNLEVD